ncbi:uncharacterized protein PV06_08856 [Exophiala oligosperma]|uniref:Uncharacterized protein n=1 Tax=Exophiala oligosperma TaxID=215243 RepID=A0A0D2D9F2_9EURO|nr:uncharacterized protein PV06_08856 [Exophiala oligosperma]KIW39040.1 hypothetical protein PV06_08856 [Exophiala oligosperma]
MSSSEVFHSLSKPTLCASQYSWLQQERLYLEQVLGDQQHRSKQLNKILQNVESKIAKALSEQSTSEVLKPLRKSRKSLRGKLGRCMKLLHSTGESLNNILSRMESLQQTQFSPPSFTSQVQQTMHELPPLRSSWTTKTFSTSIQPYDVCRQISYSTTPFNRIVPGYRPMFYHVPQTPFLRPLHSLRPDAHMHPQIPSFELAPYAQAVFSPPSPAETVSMYNLNSTTVMAPLVPNKFAYLV